MDMISCGASVEGGGIYGMLQVDASSNQQHACGQGRDLNGRTAYSIGSPHGLQRTLRSAESSMQRAKLLDPGLAGHRIPPKCPHLSRSGIS